ncbi:hypothetical protein PFISCL1PPCAC_4386 [Pristionchus fissidentatus]|uniref:C2H2-type domain-containing protein n=1 Tax=Pristionchus fissidentatus TaxID=1538716 RepID=A0AAV5V5F4_9BILA|nr:hypothetical protein PFISCL1PPCAC_4386 [Pristionchus fissidentatus]
MALQTFSMEGISFNPVDPAHSLVVGPNGEIMTRAEFNKKFPGEATGLNATLESIVGTTEAKREEEEESYGDFPTEPPNTTASGLEDTSNSHEDSDIFSSTIDEVIAAGRAIGNGEEKKKVVTRYPCETCKKSYTDKGALKRHQESHGGERRHGCDQCGKRFYRNAHLLRHLRGPCGTLAHGCPLCMRRFAAEEELKEHLEHHEEQRKTKREEQKANGIHKCPHCLLTFQYSYSLDRHVLIHSEDRPFVCDQCGRNFKRIDELRLHKVKHTGERPYPCEFCDNRYLSVADRNRHIRTAHNQLAYSCPFCPQKFSELTDMLEHQLTHNES